jgi:predicted lipoprotein
MKRVKIDVKKRTIMNTKYNRSFAFLGVLVLTIFSCTKEPATVETPLASDETALVLRDFSSVVARPVYADLASKTEALESSVALFVQSNSESDLISCKQNWRSAREAWEKSEAFLFGPVATENIDPRIDTWPVNFIDLEGELSGTQAFTAEYVNSLQDALKGFHPIEYLLFGENGNKSAVEFTVREKEYLVALAANLKQLTADLNYSWSAANADNYGIHVTNAGSGSTVYETQLAAYEEIVNAMIGIADEVAAGKISEPFLAQDPNLEESPFANNSITDFTNNIRGIEAVYTARYTADGTGIEDFVRAHNLQLDGLIKLKTAAAIAALQNITVPFGDAITQQPVQVQSAIDAINELKEVLEVELLPLVQLHIEN